MDPNATLENAREAVKNFNHAALQHGLAEERFATARTLTDAQEERREVAQVNETLLDAAQSLVDAFGALDVWLTNRGFLPSAWERPEPRREPVSPERHADILATMDRVAQQMGAADLDVDAAIDEVRGLRPDPEALSDDFWPPRDRTQT